MPTASSCTTSRRTATTTKKWADFKKCIHYHAGDATKADDWPAIKEHLCELDQQHGTAGNVLFYLSVSPQFFEPIINNIGTADMITEGRKYCSIDGPKTWQRIVVEKPLRLGPRVGCQAQPHTCRRVR